MKIKRKRATIAMESTKLPSNEKKIRGDRETKQKGSEGETGTFAYMVTDYGGTKGPRALGPLFLEDASLVLSSTPSFFSSTPLPTLQRTPNYLCLHISLLSLSHSLFPLLFLSSTVFLLYALCIWRSRDNCGLCGRTEPSFPRKRSRIGLAANRDSGRRKGVIM